MNVSGWSTKRLLRFRKEALKKLRHKERVAASHKPGTPYHTRATKEATTYYNRIQAINAELKRRK